MIEPIFEYTASISAVGNCGQYSHCWNAIAVSNIYHDALLAKYESILKTICVGFGFGTCLNALTDERRETVYMVADQAILDWAVKRRERHSLLIPTTNLQHLLNEYCALAEYI